MSGYDDTLANVLLAAAFAGEDGGLDDVIGDLASINEIQTWSSTSSSSSTAVSRITERLWEFGKTGRFAKVVARAFGKEHYVVTFEEELTLLNLAGRRAGINLLDPIWDIDRLMIRFADAPEYGIANIAAWPGMPGGTSFVPFYKAQLAVAAEAGEGAITAAGFLRAAPSIIGKETAKAFREVAQPLNEVGRVALVYELIEVYKDYATRDVRGAAFFVDAMKRQIKANPNYRILPMVMVQADLGNVHYPWAQAVAEVFLKYFEDFKHLDFATVDLAAWRGYVLTTEKGKIAFEYGLKAIGKTVLEDRRWIQFLKSPGLRQAAISGNLAAVLSAVEGDTAVKEALTSGDDNALKRALAQHMKAWQKPSSSLHTGLALAGLGLVAFGLYRFVTKGKVL